MPLFDAYLMVDWSAATKPVFGKDSIWWALVRCGDDGVRLVRRENPRTRAEAVVAVADALAELSAAGARTLVGFDFPFGYPAGTAVRLSSRLAPGAPDPPWRALWRVLGERISDAPDNSNNRFEVAERLNEELSGEAFPFWGHDGKSERRFLLRGGRRAHGPRDLPARRLCEGRVRRAQPTWKLAGNGAVGGQMLVGIPRVWQVRSDPRLASVARIWPFETGLRVLSTRRGEVVIAEVYPSILEYQPEDGMVRDACQVRTIAEYFAALDAENALARLFAGDPGLTPEERRLIEVEEAWILGVTDRPPARDRSSCFETRPADAPQHEDHTGKDFSLILRRAKPVSKEEAGFPNFPYFNYLRDPEKIYRRSIELVRAEANLSGLPEGIAAVAERLVHACGMPDIVQDLVWSDDLVSAACRTLRAGAPVIADCRMVAEGVIRTRLPAGNAVLCPLGDPTVPARAQRQGTTRAAAAVELWLPHLAGAVVAIGNAPTALFRLLEILRDGAPRPAAILGFPVGFVGASEAKEALVQAGCGVSYLTLRGRRGGSALAAAAVNALAA